MCGHIAVHIRAQIFQPFNPKNAIPFGRNTTRIPAIARAVGIVRIPDRTVELAAEFDSDCA